MTTRLSVVGSGTDMDTLSIRKLLLPYSDTRQSEFVKPVTPKKLPCPITASIARSYISPWSLTRLAFTRDPLDVEVTTSMPTEMPVKVKKNAFGMSGIAFDTRPLLTEVAPFVRTGFQVS